MTAFRVMAYLRAVVPAGLRPPAPGGRAATMAGARKGLPTAVGVQTAGFRPAQPGLTLLPGFPNPFNASVLIDAAVGAETARERVSLTVNNVGGQPVKRLVEQALPAGTYKARWDGTNHSGAPVVNGVYPYLWRAGDR